MKKVISIILTLSCVLILLSAIAFFIFGAIDLYQTLDDLRTTPGTSGIDYWGLGWGFGIVLFLFAGPGSIVSAVSIKMAYCKTVKIISTFTATFFLILISLALFVFFLF